MKKLLLIFIIAISFNSFAQEIPDSVLVDGWNTVGIIGLNLSQTALVNWSQGGSNSLAYATYANLGAVLKDQPWKWKNRLSIIYGRTKLEDVGYRTTENDIYFETVLSRNVGWVVDPFVSVTVRTAVTKGYDYSVADTNIQIVDFFDPGYVSEAIGFTYDHNIKTWSCIPTDFY